MKKSEETKPLKDILKPVEITPLKDFHIVFNQWDIDLKEGVPAPVPQMFFQNLVTEGVIKEIPNTKER